MWLQLSLELKSMRETRPLLECRSWLAANWFQVGQPAHWKPCACNGCSSQAKLPDGLEGINQASFFDCNCKHRRHRPIDRVWRVWSGLESAPKYTFLYILASLWPLIWDLKLLHYSLLLWLWLRTDKILHIKPFDSDQRLKVFFSSPHQHYCIRAFMHATRATPKYDQPHYLVWFLAKVAMDYYINRYMFLISLIRYNIRLGKQKRKNIACFVHRRCAF